MKKEAPATTAKRLNSPRQFRALSALMKGPRTVRELLAEVGGNGIPQLIAALRFKGLVITTNSKTGTDRDNRPCSYGEYCLAPESWLAAESLVTEFLEREHGSHAGE